MSSKKITLNFLMIAMAMSFLIALPSCEKKESKRSAYSKNQLSNESEKTAQLGQSAFQVVPASKICMPQDRVFPNKMFSIEYNGKTYYGCCMGCIKKIKKDPNRYIWAKDPISGETVDKADAIILDIQGKAVYFASKDNARNFASKHGKEVIFNSN